MNFKSLTKIQLGVALFASVLFLGDALATTPQARRLARQISVESTEAYRIADRRSGFGHREQMALMDLRDLQDSARDLEMDINLPRRAQNALSRVETSLNRAERSAIALRAYNRVSMKLSNISMNVRQIRREVRGGGQGPGQLRGVKRMARKYEQDIRTVLQSIRSQIRPRGQRGPRVQEKMRALRQLKQEAAHFLNVAETALRPRRVKRAFENLAATHRMTRMEVQPLLRRTGTGMYMRQASQTLREIGQRLDRVGGGHGPIGGGFGDDFGTFPRF
ncbi:MAG: hypothetical protein CME70_12655 [Halobacteriovorax sp.]|nr:hypothetical protein [Halobacteriovorax sp.]|tara:strand:- start:202226 stop:203056 length:831 start_codon:yes stop_codon:yes gene_type:complete